jgi:hypothetical protein
MDLQSLHKRPVKFSSYHYHECKLHARRSVVMHGKCMNANGPLSCVVNPSTWYQTLPFITERTQERPWTKLSTLSLIPFLLSLWTCWLDWYLVRQTFFLDSLKQERFTIFAFAMAKNWRKALEKVPQERETRGHKRFGPESSFVSGRWLKSRLFWAGKTNEIRTDIPQEELINISCLTRENNRFNAKMVMNVATEKRA